MIDSKSLSDRVLNLEDAAEYLSQKSGEKFFVNDLIGLILENQLRATCYLVQVALAQVSEEEVSRESMAFGYAEGYQLSGWHAIRSAYSSDLYEQSLADINVLNLQSGVLVKTTAKIFNEPPPDPFYKIQMLADERKENDRLYGREMLIREKLSKPELYNGVFELEMNKELSRWFKHIHAGIEPFDIEQLYFLSDDGQRFKRVYLEEFYQHGYKREQPSVTRLTLRDIKVYESDIKQLLEPPVQNAPSKDSMTLFLKHRVQVAEKYVVEHGKSFGLQHLA